MIDMLEGLKFNSAVYRQRYIKPVTIMVLAFLTSLLSACSGPGSATVIAGSTSVQPYAEILAEEFEHMYPDLEIDIQGGGSSAGITAVEVGTADIGMSSRELTEEEKSLWVVEIARDGLAIIVNPDNPVSDLTLGQVRDIYSGACADWSELGGVSSKIHIIAREDGSGTRSAFESLVMGTAEISPKSIVQDSNGAVKLLVADDPGAVGFISLGLVDETVKALKLDGIAATRETVTSGSYSLFRPFLFVTGSEPSGLAKQYIDFTLSPQGQQMLADEGLIPIP